MVDESISIPYKIISIKPSEQKKGFVEVIMEPVEPFEYQQENNMETVPPIHISGVGPNGNPFPPEFQTQLSQILQQAMPPMFKSKKPYDPRRLIHIESEIDFLSRNWKYGDIISVTLKKIKKAEDVQQDIESHG
jgi:hypothetical protein